MHDKAFKLMAVAVTQGSSPRGRTDSPRGENRHVGFADTAAVPPSAMEPAAAQADSNATAEGLKPPAVQQMQVGRRADSPA